MQNSALITQSEEVLQVKTKKGVYTVYQQENFFFVITPSGYNSLAGDMIYTLTEAFDFVNGYIQGYEQNNFLNLVPKSN